MALLLSICLQLTCSFQSSTIRIPVRLATASFLPLRAGSVAPGRHRPRASVRKFIELAVPRRLHAPHPGSAHCSSFESHASDLMPLCTSPEASIRSVYPTFSPSMQPVAITPPEQMIVGTSSLAAAIIIPGVILSQSGIRTMASKLCPFIMHSTESAISSRLASG